MKTGILFIVINFVYISALTAPACEINFRVKKQIKEGVVLYQQLEVSASRNPLDWQDSAQELPPSVKEFQKYIHAKTYISPMSLIARQKAVFHKYLGTSFDKSFNFILSGAHSFVFPITCLEAKLLNLHSRHANLNGGNEFGAAILVHPRKKKIRIHMLSNSKDDGSIPQTKAYLKRLKRDIRRGWVYAIHLHRHPFSLDNSYNDISGTTLPSRWDIVSAINESALYGLKEIRITNGFSTLSLPAVNFKAYQETLPPVE